MRSLISIDFPAPEMEPEIHMWYQLSPFPNSNVAICDAATPREHSPILRYSALLRYSVLCFNSITQCN